MEDRNLIVSIVVPCYNEEQYISRCIDSLQNQRFDGQYEIMVVDNGSTDKTVNILREKNITFEHEKKRGPAATRNRGIEKAKGDIILFMDGDCIASENWLSTMVSGFDDESIGCVAGEIFALKDENPNQLEQYLLEKGHLSQKQHVEHRFLPYAATANAGYRREVFNKIGIFDEKIFNGEDADLSWRMQLNSPFKVRYVPEARVFHPYESSLKNLFRQKRRHAYGSVMMYKRYRKCRNGEEKSLKHSYWEYRSILKRWRTLLSYLARRRFKRRITSCPVNKYQLVLETAWKIGLIQGSIRHRTWYV